MSQQKDLVAIALPLTHPNEAADSCYLCNAPIPKGGGLLCPNCELDQREKWQDYRDEQEQKRRPL